MRFLVTLAFLLSSLPSHATLNDVDKTQIANKQILVNGGFENGKASWTASAGTFAVTTSSPMIGLQHATWDAAASADTLTSTAQTIKPGMYGRNGTASCLFTTASGTATHTIQAYDGTNILSSVTITSSTTPSRTSANFIIPGSGSLSLRIYANANEPSIAIDDCYLGPAEGYNVGSVSQATFVGSAYFATTANCTFTRNNTALGALSDTDCPGPTVEVNPGPGVIQTTDTNAPDVTVNNLPAGTYRVTFRSAVLTTANVQSAMAISDGTNTYGQTSTVGNAADAPFTIEATFTYSTSGNRTFSLFASSASNVLNIPLDANNHRMYFNIYRYPVTNELAYTQDKYANSWSGYHDNTCVWTTTSTTLAFPAGDATCVLTQQTNTNFGTVTTISDGTGPQPGITFTPARAGRYWVCATPIVRGGATSTLEAALEDGAGTILMDIITAGTTNARNNMTVCGLLVATSTAAQSLKLYFSINTNTLTIDANINAAPAVTWQIIQIDQSFPQPIFANSVVSGLSTGSFGVGSAKVANNGTATVTQVGNMIASASRTAAGKVTVTFTTGFFSAAPNCTCLALNDTGVATYYCAESSGIPPTATTYSFETTNAATALVDRNISILCMGPK